MSSGSIVLAGGGTGGHIAPGLALAERFAELVPDFHCVFACSTRAVDAQMLEHAGVDFVPIPAEHLSTRPAKLLRFARAFLAGRARAKRLFREKNTRVVIALGGFVTGPVVSAASAAGIPVILLNLDARPGKANRWVAKRAAKVLTAVATPEMPRFAERVIGMPIRRAAIAPGNREHCRAALGLDPGLHTLLVTGASQGAKSLNDLLAMLLRERRPAFSGWQVLHLVGGGDRAGVEEAYREAGVKAKVVPFLHEIGLAWGAADAALSRAGANSVAEAVLNSTPTVFAPYPYHDDQHQKANAAPLAREGLAMLADDRIDAAANMESIGAALVALMTETPRRESMRAALGARPRLDAADAIARAIAELLRRGGRR